MTTRKQAPVRKCYQGEGENAARIDCLSGMDTCLRITTSDGKIFAQCSYVASDAELKDDCSVLANKVPQSQETCYCKQDFCNNPVMEMTTSSKPTDLSTNSTEGSGEITTESHTTAAKPNSSQSTFQVGIRDGQGRSRYSS